MQHYSLQERVTGGLKKIELRSQNQRADCHVRLVLKEYIIPSEGCVQYQRLGKAMEESEWILPKKKNVNTYAKVIAISRYLSGVFSAEMKESAE